MTAHVPVPLDSVFVPRSRMTLAQCIERLRNHPDLSAIRKRDLVSALNRLSSILHRAPDAIPADPGWLQPRLSKIEPAAIGLSHKTWSTLLSNAKAAFSILEIVPRGQRLSDLSPLWRPLWQRLLQSGNIRVSRSLGRFARCMDNLQIPPEAVDLKAAQTYQRALEEAELRDNPEEAMYHAMRGWNRAVRELPWWPGKPVVLPSRLNAFVLSPEAFPPAFRDEVARFRERMEAPDLLDPDALAEPLRPATVRHRIAQTWRFASAAVHGGVAIETLTSFKALLVPGNVRKGLEWMLARRNGQSGAALSDIGTLIRILATHLADLSAEDREGTIALSKRVTVLTIPGMTERNRARLRPFQNGDLFRQLIALTETVPLGGSNNAWTSKAVARHELLLAIRILLFCPIRRKNLTEIHLERNLLRFGDGRVFLRFEPEEVKNRKHLEFQLGPDLVQMIDRHLQVRRAFLAAGHCDWLFANRSGTGPRSGNNLGTQIRKLVTRELGASVNPHLFRHLAAMLWLKAEPGNYEVARLFLGHSSTSSTIAAYADFDQTGAVELLGQVVRNSGKRQ